jgi:hypothetical protein
MNNKNQEIKFAICVTDDVPVLVGYIVLEQLDFVADNSNQKLIPNPAYGGEYAVDLY